MAFSNKLFTTLYSFLLRGYQGVPNTSAYEQV